MASENPDTERNERVGGSLDESPTPRTADLRDRASAEREAAVGQREDAAGLREEAVNVREKASGRRETAVAAREAEADERDALARRRDQHAHGRDEAAELRDVESARREAGAVAAEHKAAEEPNVSAATVRALTIARTGSKNDRLRAGGDRRSSAGDRSHAEADRDAAALDRHSASNDREAAMVDALTRALMRGPGLVQAEAEIARARRSKEPLVLAFVDVNDFKQINDSIGHVAADVVLRRIADTLRGNLRPYDTVMRFGGDEFVCVVSGLSPAEVNHRLTKVNAELAQAAGQASVTIGVAELQADDSLDALLKRADADLYRQRGATT